MYRKNRAQKTMKVWQLIVGLAVGVLLCCLPFLLPQMPTALELALILVGLGVLAASALVFVGQHGGVRCPNCGQRWGGFYGFGIAKHTSEGIFRCPQCGTMIRLK